MPVAPGDALRERVGMIGLGLLGAAIAERLLAAGFDVCGFDVDPARRSELATRNGTAVRSPVEVVQAARRIVLSLPTSAVVRSVVEEIVPSLQPGMLVIDTTTGSPGEMADVGRFLAERGVEYLDATVGGSSRQARGRDAIVTAGGSPAAFEAARDILESFARKTIHVGPCGDGAKMKLVVNLVLGLNRAVLAEGLAFAGAIGLDRRKALEILKAGPSWSRAMDSKGDRMLGEDFTPEARLAQHLKDVRLILEAGAESAAVLPFSTLHCELLERLVAAGWGEADNSAVIRAFDGDGR